MIFTIEQASRAMTVENSARGLKKMLDTYVLLQSGGRSEQIVVGPIGRDNMGNPHLVNIPESARRHVFNLWRKETALRYNELVRELAQLGVTTDLRLVEFSPVTGMVR